MKISVVIPTRNRPEQLFNCLRSICLAGQKPFEIIVVDQSGKENRFKKGQIRQLNLKIKFHYQNKTGASRARNKGASLAKGEIIVFIDDDCRVAPDCFEKIAESFRENQDAACIFGKVKAYQPTKNPRHFCPSVTQVKFRQKILIDRKVVNKCGWFICSSLLALKKETAGQFPFSRLLGPGTASKGSEELELGYRLLKEGKIIYYDPKIIVFHDKWLTETKQGELHAGYEIGYSLFHTYYLLSGELFAGKVLFDHLKKIIWDNQFRHLRYSLIKMRPLVFWRNLYLSFRYLLSWLVGIMLGFYYYVFFPSKYLSINEN